MPRGIGRLKGQYSMLTTALTISGFPPRGSSRARSHDIWKGTRGLGHMALGWPRAKLGSTPGRHGGAVLPGQTKSVGPQACEVQRTLASGWSWKSLRQLQWPLNPQGAAAIAAE